MPVMEGKAALFKRFAEHRRLADLPGHPGHRRDRPGRRDDRARLRRHQPRGHRRPPLLRDRGAGCAASLDIPVFHDDQHGTAIVVLAALTNALRVVDKELADVRIVVAGGGRRRDRDRDAAARRGGHATSWSGTARAACPRTTTRCRRPRPSSPRAPTRAGSAATCRRARRRRRLHRGQRPGHARRPSGSRRWPTTRSSSRWPTPTPRSTRRRPRSTPPSWPAAARDYPNQINNVLAFPGVFRGLLDARASEITTEMLLRAAEAIAHVVKDDELNPNFIIPTRLPPRRAEGRGRGDPGRTEQLVASPRGHGSAGMPSCADTTRDRRPPAPTARSCSSTTSTGRRVG